MPSTAVNAYCERQSCYRCMMTIPMTTTKHAEWEVKKYPPCKKATSFKSEFPTWFFWILISSFCFQCCWKIMVQTFHAWMQLLGTHVLRFQKEEKNALAVQFHEIWEGSSVCLFFSIRISLFVSALCARSFLCLSFVRPFVCSSIGLFFRFRKLLIFFPVIDAS